MNVQAGSTLVSEKKDNKLHFQVAQDSFPHIYKETAMEQNAKKPHDVPSCSFSKVQHVSTLSTHHFFEGMYIYVYIYNYNLIYHIGYPSYKYHPRYHHFSGETTETSSPNHPQVPARGLKK